MTHTPVWVMRQAGRSLPEYRKVREGVGMLESCLRPDLVTEITLQPVRRYGVDAAILFSDIVLPVKAAGVDLDIKPGVGPVVADTLQKRTGSREPTDSVEDKRHIAGLKPECEQPMVDVAAIRSENGLTTQESPHDGERSIQKRDRKRHQRRGHAENGRGFLAPQDAVTTQ